MLSHEDGDVYGTGRREYVTYEGSKSRPNSMRSQLYT